MRIINERIIIATDPNLRRDKGQSPTHVAAYKNGSFGNLVQKTMHTLPDGSVGLISQAQEPLKHYANGYCEIRAGFSGS